MTNAIAWTGRILTALGALLVLGVYFAAWHAGGMDRLMEVLSPRNVEGYLFAVITLAPGIVCLLWAKHAKANAPRR